MAVGNAVLLAGPVDTVVRLAGLVFEASFLSTVGFSLVRIAGGFVAAFVSAVLLALAAHRWQLVEDTIAPAVAALKSVPHRVRHRAAAHVGGIALRLGHRRLPRRLPNRVLLGARGAARRESAGGRDVAHVRRTRAPWLLCPHLARTASLSAGYEPQRLWHGMEVRRGGRAHRQSHGKHRRADLSVQDLARDGRPLCVDHRRRACVMGLRAGLHCPSGAERKGESHAGVASFPQRGRCLSARRGAACGRLGRLWREGRGVGHLVRGARGGVGFCSIRGRALARPRCCVPSHACSPRWRGASPPPDRCP